MRASWLGLGAFSSAARCLSNQGVHEELAQRRFCARVLGNVGCLSGDGAAARSEVHAQRVEGGLKKKTDMGRGGRNAGSLARLRRLLVFWRSWCCAALRVCQTLSRFLMKLLMIACMLVAGSPLVTGSFWK